MPDETPIKKLLKVPVVSGTLDTTDARTRDLIRKGFLKAVRIGRQVRVSEDELRRFIEQGGQKLAGDWRRKPIQAA
jgi:excisionase family DNA binding protein